MSFASAVARAREKYAGEHPELVSLPDHRRVLLGLKLIGDPTRSNASAHALKASGHTVSAFMLGLYALASPLCRQDPVYFLYEAE